MPYNLFRMFRTVLLSSGTPWSGHVECWIWRTVCTLRDCKIKNRKLQAISYGLCSGKPEKSKLGRKWVYVAKYRISRIYSNMINIHQWYKLTCTKKCYSLRHLLWIGGSTSSSGKRRNSFITLRWHFAIRLMNQCLKNWTEIFTTTVSMSVIRKWKKNSDNITDERYHSWDI
jgi:hypothetical protein